MKVYKVEVLIVDHDDLGPDEIQVVLENTRYPNHCMYPTVMKIESRDIGEWEDSHPINSMVTMEDTYNELFKK